jgi:hypothetical protein
VEGINTQFALTAALAKGRADIKANLANGVKA